MSSIGRREFLGASAAIAGAVGIAASAQVATEARLAGKSVLITGCSSGFGRLAAIECAKRGARVFATMRNLGSGGKMRREGQELMDLAASGKWQGFTVLDLDVTKDKTVALAVSKAQEMAGGALDAVINNAGIGLGGPVELADVEAMAAIMDTNLYGYLRVARAALPAMRKRKQGLVICVSSQLGRIVIPGLGLYGGTKFAVECMFETMAYELAPHGVEVTIIQPGGYPTNIWKSGAENTATMIARQSAEAKTAYGALVEGALGRSGGGSTDPNDVARAMADLVAMSPGTRPLRRPVHPETRATDAVNTACSQVQAAVLSRGPYADWHKSVTS